MRLCSRCCLIASLLSLSVSSVAQGQSVSEVTQHTAALRGRIEANRSKVSQAKAELEALESTEQKRRDRVTKQARTLYRFSRVGWLPLSGGAEALLGHFSRMRHLNRVVEKETKSLSKMREHRAALHKEVSRLEAQLESDDAKLSAWSERQHVEHMQAVASAADTRDESYAQLANRMGGTVHVHGEAVSGGFEGLRGRVPQPMREVVEIRDGRRETDVGLEFVGLPDASIYSVAEGRVAYVGRTAALGTIVIVDHGDRYFTVYAGLSATSVQNGDYVSAGAKLGSLEATELFFAVRRGAQSLDARSWLGL